MNRDQRWITDAFLAELENLKRGESAPMDVTSKRLAMCDMILTELDDADPEQMAWLATASAFQEVCLDPMNPDVIDQFRAVLNAHAELLRATFPGLD